MTSNSSGALSNRPSRVRKTVALVLLCLSVLGVADAGFLTYEHFQGATVPCSIVHGCEQVTTSQYAVVFGVPVALLGLLYYLALFGLSLLLVRKERPWIVPALRLLTSIGLLVSAVLVWLQISVIGAICLYCMMSAALSVTAWLSSMFGLRRRAQD